jgi:hypothetical protein
MVDNFLEHMINLMDMVIWAYDWWLFFVRIF